MIIIIAMLVGFAAWHSGTNLLYLVFATIIAVYLLHGILLRLNLAKLSVVRHLPDHAYALSPVRLGLEAFNSKRQISSYALRVLDANSDGQLVGACFLDCVGKNESVRLEYETLFSRRGLVELQTLSLVSSYPFALEERGVQFQRPETLLVYPALHGVAAVVKAIPSGLGDQESPRKGIGTDLYGMREYVQGEHARHIHWRSSAKVQRLMVIEYEKDERRQVSLVLDNCVAGQADRDLHSESFETAISMTASLARYYVLRGNEIRLITASGAVAFGQSTDHLQTILRVLATLELVEGRHVAVPKPGNENVIGVRYHDDHSLLANHMRLIDVRDWEISDGKFIRRSAA